MGAEKAVLHATVEPVDPNATYGYPTDITGLFILQSELGTVHLIWNAGVPTSGSEFANAPNGSIYVDTTNADTWVKSLAVGSGINGTWTQT